MPLSGHHRCRNFIEEHSRAHWEYFLVFFRYTLFLCYPNLYATLTRPGNNYVDAVSKLSVVGECRWWVWVNRTEPDTSGIFLNPLGHFSRSWTLFHQLFYFLLSLLETNSVFEHVYRGKWVGLSRQTTRYTKSGYRWIIVEII